MILITGGKIYDPINNINGRTMDILVDCSQIVGLRETPSQCLHSGDEGTRSPKDEWRDRAEEVIDASGMIVMPGGVDIHTHVAGPKVNVGRILCPEYHRPPACFGASAASPSTLTTGYLYTQMGYTTLVEAAVPPLKSRHTHEELEDIPICDKLALVLMGNNHFVLECTRKKDIERLTDYVSWLLWVTRGYGIKVVNPGGVEAWKWGRDVSSLDDRVPGFDVTPREVIGALMKARETLNLPHPVHLHTNNLGVPGNVDTTLATMAVTGEEFGVDSPELHVCHAQFSGYSKKHGFSSGAAQIADYVNSHPNITIDVGQVMFTETLTMTGDAPLEFRLAQQLGAKWTNNDIEMECGSGVLPVRFKKRERSSAVQWITGLEMFLLMEDPWRISLTTDHPNGAPFSCYPEIIGLLTDAGRRAEYLSEINPRALKGSVLPDLNRQYTLWEIAIITRAGPAKRLGLRTKGNLSLGSDADIAIYEPKSDLSKTFSRAKVVLKGGRVVVRDGEIVEIRDGATYFVSPQGDLSHERALGRMGNELEEAFKKYYSVSLSNYGAGSEFPHMGKAIKC